MAKNLSSLSIALLAASMSACGMPEYVHKPFYQVDPILEPYITLFEQKAFERQLNIHVNDIKVYFVEDLGEDEDSVTLALCKTYETSSGQTAETPEIEVDRQEFERLTTYGKEAVMFHELGHCVLGRNHNDDIVPSEENRPVSIMSTYLVGAYYYNKYYSSYINELFNGR